MPCDRPDGDCTNASPCGQGCGCSDGGTQPAPITPRCQDIVLTPGTYPRATVVVNAQGCIAQVVAGEPEVYTPDECCQGGTGGAGGGLPGPRGEPGDPGQAATIEVDPSVPINGTANWTVQNVGTPSAALFRFTAPAPLQPTWPSGGFTGNVAGLEVAQGLVTAVPPAILHGVTAEKDGAQAPNFVFTASPVSPAQPHVYRFLLNLDGLAAAVQATVAADTSALDTRVTALESAAAGAPDSVFEVAAATGVNLLHEQPVGVFTVVPTAKVPGLVANTWYIGTAHTGATITASTGASAVVDAAGRVVLAALAYPTGIS